MRRCHPANDAVAHADFGATYPTRAHDPAGQGGAPGVTDSQTSSNAARTVAVTGAMGFVGRALVPRLMEAGYAVRRLGRHPETFNTVEGVDDRRFDLDDERPDAAALVGVERFSTSSTPWAAAEVSPHATARTRSVLLVQRERPASAA